MATKAFKVLGKWHSIPSSSCILDSNQKQSGEGTELHSCLPVLHPKLAGMELGKAVFGLEGPGQVVPTLGFEIMADYSH